MKKSVFIVLLFLSIWTIQAQERKLFWDGYDWRKVDHVCREYPEYKYWIKSAYLSGLFDSKLFYQLTFRNTGSECSDSVFSDLLEPDNMRSLITGLDGFYEDNTIRYIPIPSALIATIMIQQNYPQIEIDAYLWQSRDWINDLMDDVIKE
ncbi:hypothetical protein KJ762_06720 [bacterium]|nr:hypothetical protein [bacterium]MBU1065863.1 hypothetical protein [bacterium]MBU1634186.1 hypothetical protein [bacterium]MBU1872805.1 hypothetical protein [bacterium]